MSDESWVLEVADNDGEHVDYVAVDLENRMVSRNGQEVWLEPKEFAVLSIMIRNINKTLSRDKILNEVWGADCFCDPHTLDVRVSNLRKKLGYNIVRTVPKYGYRLEDGSNMGEDSSSYKGS